MSFLSTRFRRDRQAKEPLLSSGATGTDTSCEEEEHAGSFSGGSSPSLSSHEDHKPSSGRTLNFEFGPVAANPRPQVEIDSEIVEAVKELKEKRGVYHEQMLVYNNAIDVIDNFSRQYNDEQQKAPVYPPKGTWFHYERKVFPQKKAEHDEKLRFILRIRQAVIDNDLPKAEGLLSTATDAVNDAQTKLDKLRREKRMSEV